MKRTDRLSIRQIELSLAAALAEVHCLYEPGPTQRAMVELMVAAYVHGEAIVAQRRKARKAKP